MKLLNYLNSKRFERLLIAPALIFAGRYFFHWFEWHRTWNFWEFFGVLLLTMWWIFEFLDGK